MGIASKSRLKVLERVATKLSLARLRPNCELFRGSIDIIYEKLVSLVPLIGIHINTTFQFMNTKVYMANNDLPALLVKKSLQIHVYHFNQLRRVES